MTHAFMEAVAAGLAKRDIATLRYQFPLEMGRKSPDAPATAHARCVLPWRKPHAGAPACSCSLAVNHLEGA
jgi:hypothetical protein